MKYIYVLERCPNIIQCWTDLQKGCEANDIPYEIVKELPTTYKDWIIRRIELNSNN